MANKRWNWDHYNELAKKSGPFKTIRELANFLMIPYGTVYSAVERGDLMFSSTSPAEASPWPVDDDGVLKKIQPVVISGLQARSVEPPPTSNIRVMYITDPHFGYRRIRGRLEPIHARRFLAALMVVAMEEAPDIIVWGGDTIDFAEFSRWDAEPELMHSTQLAAIEASWVLGQFRSTTNRQVVLEGNHDARLQKAIVKYLRPAYQLAPADDPLGEPLLSVPRLLGLQSADTEWVGGYPDSHYAINGIRFCHGSAARSGSGKTVSFLAYPAAGSSFFGHIHRYEVVSKYVPELDKHIWIGCPGCACHKGAAPGSSVDDNWQLGAFFVHIDGPDVVGVEHITAYNGGSVTFRGKVVGEVDYMESFLKAIPEEYAVLY